MSHLWPVGGEKVSVHLPVFLLTLCPVCPNLMEWHKNCLCQTSCESYWIASSSETLNTQTTELVKINRDKSTFWHPLVYLHIRSNLCVVARLCVPFPPTVGWCHSYWQVLSELCGLQTFPSYKLLQESVASLLWSLTSKLPRGTLGLCRLKYKFNAF